MEIWINNLIEGLVFLSIGIAITVYTFIVIEPIIFLQKINQIVSINPTFFSLVIIGLFIAGVGTGQVVLTITIRKLEKKIENIK